ncbi:MAG: CocE/NonD family hydrolase [Roseimicrobium sp.]
MHSNGNANTRQGRRVLSLKAPNQDEAPDTFCANPAKPPLSTLQKAAIWGPVNQGTTKDGDDVLVDSSEPMTEPLNFASNAEAKLHVSTITNTPDADWAVKLIDVHPDAFAHNIARGILRGRYRASLLKPELMQPGQVYEITVDLGPVAAAIAKRNQVRVDISGADFPLSDHNPNTAEGITSSKTAIATEQVHCKPGALSSIVLPVRIELSPTVGIMKSTLTLFTALLLAPLADQ